MKKSTLKISIIIFMICVSGCAVTYQPINPPSLEYNSHDMQDGIELSYKYDVLQKVGNRKYAKKEVKSGVKIIAVKLTNSTDTIITIGKNAAFFSGQEQIFPMEPMEIKQSIKQIVPGYLPFMFLTLITLNVYKGNSASSYPIGFVLGPMITAANMTMAGKANKNMLTELYEFNILNKDILAGETVFGLIGVRDMDFAPLTVKMKN